MVYIQYSLHCQNPNLFIVRSNFTIHDNTDLSRLDPDLNLGVVETVHHRADDPRPELVTIYLLPLLLLPDAEQHEVVEHQGLEELKTRQSCLPRIL